MPLLFGKLGMRDQLRKGRRLVGNLASLPPAYPVHPERPTSETHRSASRSLLLRRLRADRLSSAVAHDGEFVRRGLPARRELQSQPYPDPERRTRRKPKDQNDRGPGRDQGLLGRNK
jgi:hypothetical protein